MNHSLWVSGCLASTILLAGPTAAQPPYRVFVDRVGSPVTDGATRHEYVKLLTQRDACAGVVAPTSREDLADFTIWFDYEAPVHSMLLWDADGNLIDESGGVFRGRNIVDDVCEAIRKHIRKHIRR